MSVDDVFRVTDTAQWNVEVEKELMFRFADVKITSESGYPFSMMLYFKSDTPDLARFDTPEKIARSVRASSEPYLPHVVEKEIELQPVPVSYGFFTVLTDAELAGESNIEPGQYRYLTRGLVRLSTDSALGFSIMTSDIDSPAYEQLLEYVYGFVKPGADR